MKMCKLIIRPILPVVLILLLAATACSLPGGGPEATEEPVPVPLEPITSEPPPEQPQTGDEPPLDPLSGFKQGLALALGSQPLDYAGLASFMGDTFEFLIWRGNGEQLTPSDATNALQTFLLPPGNTFIFEEADIASMMGIDPHEFYANPSIADFMFTRGWGEDGSDEALLVIGQNPDGTYYWGGVLMVYGGFAMYDQSDISGLAIFREHLIQAWMPATRDLVFLENAMVDPFMIAGVFAPYYDDALPPAEALARMEADGILPVSDPSIVTNDLEAIIEQVNISLIPSPPDVVDFVWVGQTADGTQNIILVIGQDDAGNYTFAEVRIIPVGFQTPVDFAREQILDAWMPATRNLVALESLMNDPFYIGGAAALIYGPMSPADAITQMLADSVLATNVDPEGVTHDIETILQGTNFDPSSAVPDAIDYVWVGQTDDGQFNVILVIGPDDAGTLKLTLVLMIPINYKPPGG